MNFKDACSMFFISWIRMYYRSLRGRDNRIKFSRELRECLVFYVSLILYFFVEDDTHNNCVECATCRSILGVISRCQQCLWVYSLQGCIVGFFFLEIGNLFSITSHYSRMLEPSFVGWVAWLSVTWTLNRNQHCSFLQFLILWCFFLFIETYGTWLKTLLHIDIFNVYFDVLFGQSTKTITRSNW